ncbi:MAG: anthranilate synthase component I family protein [Candidatus Eremiobacteraeota bacterium]|nr:anthranilate synthase component I family protein [Candidatus Eremiobacteraeota bacterium]
MSTVSAHAACAQRSFIADTVTPIGAYRALEQVGASCLLESVESGAQLSRYSFIGLDYLAQQTFAASPTLLPEIRAFVDEHSKAMGPTLGFPGAAVLACGYDAARAYARLGERKPLSPPTPDAYVAIPGTWLIFDHYTHRLQIHTVAASEGEAAGRAEQYEHLLMHAHADIPETTGIQGAVTQSIDRDTYLALVERIKAHIYDGDVYQLQLGIRFSAELRGEPLDLYRHLRSKNPSPYMFFMDTPFGQLLGASPEFLVRLEEGRARIRPLAGTRSRGSSKSDDVAIERELLSNEKERAEHVMLVDLGRNDLGSVCKDGSVSVHELMHVERYSHVMHIVSDLVGDLREDCDGLDLFGAGFPAGTVTGTPKIRAMQLIDEFEPVSRGFYAGSIGRLEFGGNFDSCITLRSVHVAHGRAWWQASAGIVADSDPQSEYDEVFHKTRIIREVLGC